MLPKMDINIYFIKLSGFSKQPDKIVNIESLGIGRPAIQNFRIQSVGAEVYVIKCFPAN